MNAAKKGLKAGIRAERISERLNRKVDKTIVMLAGGAVHEQKRVVFLAQANVNACDVQ
jgi:hypothetical protein